LEDKGEIVNETVECKPEEIKDSNPVEYYGDEIDLVQADVEQKSN